MDTQVPEVSSTTGCNYSSQQERTSRDGGTRPLGPVQDSTVSSTTGEHDPDVVAALVQLMDNAAFDATGARVRDPEAHAAALQLLDEAFVTVDDLFE